MCCECGYVYHDVGYKIVKVLDTAETQEPTGNVESLQLGTEAGNVTIETQEPAGNVESLQPGTKDGNVTAETQEPAMEE